MTVLNQCVRRFFIRYRFRFHVGEDTGVGAPISAAGALKKQTVLK